MALQADSHGAALEARIAEILPLTDPQALSDLGLSPDDLEALQRRLRGKIVAPGMPEYERARIGNPVYPGTFRPRLIIYCAVAADVRIALETAHRFGLTPTCRSGGHSSAGFSVNDAMVIDVSLMNHVAVDAGGRRARVGAGATLGALNATLGVYGLHVPGGTCDDVGVAGHMMGGGYGFTSRQYGMNCDRVVGATLMCVDGTIVEATTSTNADLLWAIRGGTGNQFGVLLDVTYELADAYALWGFFLRWPAADSAAALDALQSGYMRSGASDNLGYLTVYTTFGDDRGLAVIGTYNGSAEAGKAELAALQAIGTPSLDFDATDTYESLNDALLAKLPGIPPPPAGAGVFEAKGARYIDKPLGENGWQSVLDYYEHTPSPFNIVVIEPYGGAISRYPVEDSAFVHRAVDMDFFVDSFWEGQPTGPDRDRAESWLAGYLEVVADFTNGHVYQDYPQRDFADYRWAYWGDAFPTLLEVKQRYDPDNLLAFEQSISPPPPGVTVSTAPPRFENAPIERTAYPPPLELG